MRPTQNEVFMEMANTISQRSTCNRAHVGCVLVNGDRVVSMGYNGSLSGTPHCEDVGCIMHQGHCIRCIHAEVNAVINAAKNGVKLDGSVAYVTHKPCHRCFMTLAQAGVSEIFYVIDYGTIGDDTISKLFQTGDGWQNTIIQFPPMTKVEE